MINRKASPGRCARCKVWILVGIDDGLMARADPYRLTAAQETMATVVDRWCYTLTGGYLIKRDGYLRRGPVLAEHVCGHPIGSPVPARSAPMASNPDAPPY